MRSANAKSKSVKLGNAAPRSVDEYLAAVSEPARSTLHKIRAAIRSALPPEASEAISYRMPSFKYKGPLLWYAAFSDHCSLFPTAAVIAAFKNELKGFLYQEGDHPFPRGQAAAGNFGQEISESAIGTKSTKETALKRLLLADLSKRCRASCARLTRQSWNAARLRRRQPRAAAHRGEIARRATPLRLVRAVRWPHRLDE